MTEKPPVVADYKKSSFFSDFAGHIAAAAVAGLLCYFGADKDVVVRAIKALNRPIVVQTNIIQRLACPAHVVCDKCKAKSWSDVTFTNFIGTVRTNSILVLPGTNMIIGLRGIEIKGDYPIDVVIQSNRFENIR